MKGTLFRGRPFFEGDPFSRGTLFRRGPFWCQILGDEKDAASAAFGVKF